MATLHLPKKRLVSSKEESVKSARHRAQDEWLEESPAPSGPVSGTVPGSTREDEARSKREHPSS